MGPVFYWGAKHRSNYPPHPRLALAIFYQVFPPKVLLSFPGRSPVSVFDELHMSKTNNGGRGRGGLLFVILP